MSKLIVVGKALDLAKRIGESVPNWAFWFNLGFVLKSTFFERRVNREPFISAKAIISVSIV